MCLQVFFESDHVLDQAALADAFDHVGELVANPLNIMLAKCGYVIHPKRYQRNFKTLRAAWKGAHVPALAAALAVCGSAVCSYPPAVTRLMVRSVVRTLRKPRHVFRRTITRVRAAVLDEALARPLPDDSAAFWACLLRAFPLAATDTAQYEKALSNVALVYGAGTETTAASISMTLAALAADRESLSKLEQARLAAVQHRARFRMNTGGQVFTWLTVVLTSLRCACRSLTMPGCLRRQSGQTRCCPPRAARETCSGSTASCTRACAASRPLWMAPRG